MITINSNEEANALIKNGVLAIEDDLVIAFDGFRIEADIKCKNIYSKRHERDINTYDITYYAVCFAHENIICDSIKGRRVNAKHFCLDGEITIRGEK